MTDVKRIMKAEEFLKSKFDGSEYLTLHGDAKAYRLEHSFRVANIGRIIAEKEGFDETEAVIACLLHDVAYCEEFGESGWIEHGRHSARIARPFLEELGFPKDRIDDMCYGIAIHVDDKADFYGERTPFALSVGDADNIDRFDVYRIHETLRDDGFLEMGLSEKKAYVEKRVSWIGRCLKEPFGTKTAEKMRDERLAFYLMFFEKLGHQLSHSESIVV